jgi:hypothetical protein
MKQPKHSYRRIHLVKVWLGALVAVPLCLGLLGPSQASAAFEQVGCFAGSFPGLNDSCKPILPPPESQSEFGEEVQLGGTGGMAVNYTGNGGVPAGTVYAATNGSGPEALRIAMYTPKVNPTTSELELQFTLSWKVTETGGTVNRCGPTLPEKCEARPAEKKASVDVDVDQTTGNVYVLDGEIFHPGRKIVVVYGPQGEEEITRFGELSPVGPKTSETPEKIHETSWPGGLAVNGAGEAYVFDANFFDGPSWRLMMFRPKVPGVFNEYEYAGLSADVGAGAVGAGSEAPEVPVADAAGNIYVAPAGNQIEMYDPSNPGSPPVCRFEFTKGGITSITVNPQTGEVFFFSYKPPKRVRRLGPCNPATGKFEESEPQPEAFALAPERDDLWGLAFDPVRQFGPGRAPGILYGGAPNPVPNLGEGEEGQSSLGYIFAPPKEVAPKVEAQSVSHVTATGAVLQATIDPNGFDTNYAFQYLSAAQYEANPPEGRFAGAKEAPTGGGAVKGGEGAQSVSTAIGGLGPDTEYRFRVIATSECVSGKACEGEGEAEGFRTFPLTPPGLPDKRAYELVSPPQKNGGQVLPADPDVNSCGPGAECKPGAASYFPMQSAPGGDSIVYEGTAFFPGVGAAIENEYIARRGPKAAWQSTDLTPALVQRGGPGYQAFDQDLTTGLLGQLGPALIPLAPEKYANVYAQPTAEPLSLNPLLVSPPPSRPAIGTGEFQLKYAGASSDLSRVFFKANDALTEATPFAPAAALGTPTQFNLYEWERATGQVRLVNVKPGNSETEVGATLGTPSAHGVSTDASKVFWSDEAGNLYVRENAEVTKSIPGKFLSASAGGSKVLLDDGCLYDLQSETCEDLTLDQSETHKGGFKGIAGQSEDLSRIYFVDTEVLSGEEENSEGAKAQVGKFNLYAWSEGGPARYVATLDAEDNKGTTFTHTRTWASLPSQRTAQASPGGRFLVFQSQTPLTGFDSTGPCGSDSANHFVKATCSEVFLYDSASGELNCPSCNSTGASPLGWSVLRLIKGPETLPQPRYLTDQGRLYFDSRDSLSLADTNDGVEDVYQYEPDGIGTCKRAAGCVSLISAGTGTVDSNFLAADETGKNVFFTTRDQLVLKDKDELFDLYDAREGGGIAAETETQRPECQGEACQPAPVAPPEQRRVFKGPGNFKSPPKVKPRCPKGKRTVRRHGKARCVTQPRHGSNRHTSKAKGNNDKHGGAR